MSVLKRVLGQINESDDVVPVVATVPASRRLAKLRDRKNPEKSKRDEDPLGESSLVRQLLGEGHNSPDADEQNEDDNAGAVIPADAEDLDDAATMGPVTAELKTVVKEKEPVSEPQTINREGLIPPASALTAPDATPDAFTPIDPSKVPGSFSRNRFSSQDAAKAPPVPVGASGADRTMQTMDTILGRDRSEKFEQSGRVMTPESAKAMFAPAKSGQEILNEGVPMPDPVAADSKKVMNVFRRFA